MPASPSIFNLARMMNRSTWRNSWLPALLAAVAAFVVYAITLGGSYVYDDTILHEDPRFTHPELWWKFWTQAYMPGAVDRLYRPLTCLTFAVQYTLHGDRPWAYHLVNILLHAGVAAAVAKLARRLIGFRTAVIAGLLFAIHPIHVEAVAGLVGRAELLCALATLIALRVFLKPLSPWRVITIFGCYLIALLSKEQGILLPIFLLALVPFRKSLLTKNVTPAYSPGGLAGSVHAQKALSQPELPTTHPTSDKTNAERGLTGILIATLCLVTAAYIVFREQLLGFGWDRQALDWTANPLIRSTGAYRYLMPIVLVGRYIGLLIAPAKLSLDYGTHVIGWNVDWRQPWFYLGAGSCMGWALALALTVKRKKWAAFFCLIALAISYGMVSNAVILIGTIFGERLMYLPSAFFLILVAALLAKVRRAVLLIAIMTILIALGSVRTFTRAKLWNDPLNLYLADLNDHPLSMHLHGLVVDRYLAQGDFRAARAVAEDSLRRLPDCEESYRTCIAADIRLHDFADAERVLANPDPRCSRLKIMKLREGLAAVRKSEGR